MIKKISILSGLMLGAFALSVAASAWVSAPSNPPNNNVDAPINAGLNTQSKLGSLLLNTDATNPFPVGLTVWGESIFNGPVQITSGTPGQGKVLTDTDGNGTLGWAGSASGQSINFLSSKGDLGALTSSYQTFDSHDSSIKAVLVYIYWSSGYCENCAGTVYTTLNGSISSPADVELLSQKGGGKDTSNPNAGVQAWIPAFNGKYYLKASGSYSAYVLGYIK